jgi:hypothetical protein
MIPITLVSTRFNESTWSQNQAYRAKHKCCSYSAPAPMSPKIGNESLVLVVEMNNDKNRIEGIGLIRNSPLLDRYYKTYDYFDYNRYFYKSNYHIPREKLLEYNARLVGILDYILFKEKTHMKRGSGFTTIPAKLLNHERCNRLDIKQEIKGAFLSTYKNQEPFCEKNSTEKPTLVSN